MRIIKLHGFSCLRRRFGTMACAAGLLSTIILAGLMSSACRPQGSDAGRGMRALIGAFSERRLIEPRLSGGFKNGRLDPNAADRAGINERDLNLARNLISDAVVKGGTANILAYARLLLSEADQQKLPEAARYLRRAIADAPDAAGPRNDLGVCLILQDRVEDALDEFEAALKTDPQFVEALFNKALCYERLLLRDAAAENYRQLAGVEPDPGWLAEINARLAEASRPLTPQRRMDETLAAFHSAIEKQDQNAAEAIADRSFETIWKHATEQLPASFLRESTGGNLEKAEHELAEIELIGKMFQVSKRDSTIADLGTYLRNLSPAEREIQLRMVEEYLDAGTLYGQRRYADALVAFRKLAKLFGEQRNQVFQGFSTHFAASCLYVTGQLAESVSVLETQIPAERPGWVYRRANELLQLAIAYSRLDQDSRAIKYCDEARSIFSGTDLFLAKVLQYLSDAYWHLGDADKGLNCLRQSTSLFLSTVPSLGEVAFNYLNIADLYRLRGNYELALLYSEQALSIADQGNDTSRAAQASAFSAAEYARAHRPEEGERRIREAFDLLNRIDAGQLAYTKPFVFEKAGDMAAEMGDSRRSIGYYTESRDLLGKAQERTVQLIEVLRERAGEYMQQGDFDKARVDLAESVSHIEAYRRGIAERENRSSFLNASQSVFDEMISLQIRAFGNTREAFEFSEQSHARTLLDEYALSSGAPASKTGNEWLGLERIQAALPDDLCVIAYSVTERDAFIFVVTATSCEVAKSPVATDALDGLVRGYVSDLRNIAPIEEITPQARQLYDCLIEPVRQYVGDRKKLCIIPDKALHFLPFAALMDQSAKYLIESKSLTYAPSATVLAHCLEAAASRRGSGPEEIAAVGNPAIDNDAFPLLDPLPDAEQEAVQSAGYYPKSTVLIGQAATEAAVTDALKNCDVAHIAAHCLVEEKSPWLAALLLAKPRIASDDRTLENAGRSSPDDGRLYLNEIYKFSLPRTRLVVLSACQSGLGAYYRGEGLVSLVRPFLALGVPTVVASLWSVDSRATASLMKEFHRQRMLGPLETGDAIRAAQNDVLRTTDHQHPYYWAPFIVIGSQN